MLIHRFTRRGCELMFAPDKGAPAGGAAPAPAGTAPVQVRGVTLAERNSRSAQERELSPANEAIVPGLGDITRNLNMSGYKFANEGGAVEQPGETETELETEPVAEATNGEEETESEVQVQEGEDEQQSEAEGEQASGEEQVAEAEAEELPASEAEEVIGEVIEADGKKYKLPPEVQKSINGRIGELTAKRKEAEEKLAAITAEKEQLAQQVAQKGNEPLRIAPTPENPLADVVTASDLDRKIQEAQDAKLWAIENPDGAEVIVNAETGEKQFIEPTRVRSILANAERTLGAAPKRREYLQAKVQADEIGRKAYPDLFKPGTPGNTALQQVRRGLPWLVAQFPDADLIIADAMLGKQLREKQAAQVRPPLKPVPKSHVPAQPKPAPRVPAKQIEGRDGKKAFVETRGDARSTLKVAESLVG